MVLCFFSFRQGRRHTSVMKMQKKKWHSGLILQQRASSRRTSLSDSRRLFCRKKGSKACRTKGKTSYCRYKQKSLLAATAALLNHLISFPKKVQVHFGQDNVQNILLKIKKNVMYLKIMYRFFRKAL